MSQHIPRQGHVHFHSAGQHPLTTIACLKFHCAGIGTRPASCPPAQPEKRSRTHPSTPSGLPAVWKPNRALARGLSRVQSRSSHLVDQLLRSTDTKRRPRPSAGLLECWVLCTDNNKLGQAVSLSSKHLLPAHRVRNFKRRRLFVCQGRGRITGFSIQPDLNPNRPFPSRLQYYHI